jgi:hypothetical protein
VTSTLTDRYVAATVRRVPEDQRQEIERELRAAIADDVEARVEAGAPPDDAEYRALAELGDPARLATRYTGRAAVLIGPATYPAYVRTLRVMGLIVLPVCYLVNDIGYWVRGANAGAAIFGPLGTTFTVAMYLVVGVTLLFVIMDRKGVEPPVRAGAREWTPDQLPDAERRRPPAGFVETVTQVVLAGLLVIGLCWQRTASPVTGEHGGHVPIIAPSLWSFWLPYLLVVIVLALAYNLKALWVPDAHRVGATVRTVLAVAFFGPLAWLCWQARVLNHALGHGTGAVATAGSWLGWLLAAGVVVVLAGTVIGAWRQQPADAC